MLITYAGAKKWLRLCHIPSASLYIPVERCPGDVEEFANIPNGVGLVSVELFGHRDVP